MTINRTRITLRIGAAHYDVTAENDEGAATVDLTAMPAKHREATLKAVGNRWKQERVAAIHAAKDTSNG